MSIYFLRRPSKGSSSSDKIQSKQQPPQPDIAAITAMYEQLHLASEEEDDIIGPDGIVKMCEELGIDASTDIEILIVAWKFKARVGSQFSKSEFESGMSSLGCESLAQLKAKLPELRKELDDPSKYREFYRFVFQISREGTARTIEKEVIIALLRLVLGSRSVHTESFCTFLEEGTPTHRITFDQWNNFLEFSHTVAEDLTGYDPNGAWPILLDEFVEWKQEQLKKKGS